MRSLIAISLLSASIFGAEKPTHPAKRSEHQKRTRVIIVEPRVTAGQVAADAVGSAIGTMIGQALVNSWMRHRDRSDPENSWAAFSPEPPQAQELAVPIAAPPVPQLATFVIESNQDAAEVFIDAKSYGPAPVTATVSSGPRFVMIRKPGFKDWTREVETRPGEEVKLRGEMKPVEQQTFVITIKPTAPKAAE